MATEQAIRMSLDTNVFLEDGASSLFEKDSAVPMGAMRLGSETVDKLVLFLASGGLCTACDCFKHRSTLTVADADATTAAVERLSECLRKGETMLKSREEAHLVLQLAAELRLEALDFEYVESSRE